ncbi:unnamed protein product [Lathyrus sativus]|nr:unnamed protein product [Lathyrus sativus]
MTQSKKQQQHYESKRMQIKTPPLMHPVQPHSIIFKYYKYIVIIKGKKTVQKAMEKIIKNRAQSLPRMLQQSSNGPLFTLSLSLSSSCKSCFLTSTLYLSIPSNKWFARGGKEGGALAQLT